MNTRNFPSHVSMLTTAAAAVAVLGISACAAAAPAFNPDDLQQAQLARVTQVCQNVMGLSPAERLIGGEWLGDSRLEYWTSRYRGCLTSLSDSVQRARDLQLKQQAERNCRAKGYAAGTPDLALCTLQARPQPEDADAGNPGQPDVEPVQTANGSLFYASAAERRRREELACAAVGIEPTSDGFTACVRDLQHTFHAIDTPIT